MKVRMLAIAKEIMILTEFVRDHMYIIMPFEIFDPHGFRYKKLNSALQKYQFCSEKTIII